MPRVRPPVVSASEAMRFLHRAGAMLAGDTLAQSLRFGGLILLWGVFVRTVLVWHITWSVNSLGHVSGYRTYPTNDDSRNSPLSHENGVWRLNGYVAVEGLKGVWQGVPSYRLVAAPMSTKRTSAE